MSKLCVHYDVCHESTPKVLMTRIVGTAATAITQSTLAAISYLVKRYSTKADAENDADGTVVVSETALTLASVVYNTLQTDNDWTNTADSVGYNFKMALPAAALPVAGQWYVVEVWCDPISGDDFIGGLFFLHCRPTRR